MSVLIDKQILHYLETKDIVIEPFVERHLNTTSYDVTLGSYYFREHRTQSMYYNMYDKESVHSVWGEPQEAVLASTLPHRFRRGIKNDDRVILLKPGETILAHTNEFIGGKRCITTEMKARSTLGRSFIAVCKCAGWGDIGYTNKWTFEITNFSKVHIIPLVVGRRIAQIIFYKTQQCDRNYCNEGKYHDDERGWSPYDMLPRAYDDYEVPNEMKL